MPKNKEKKTRKNSKTTSYDYTSGGSEGFNINLDFTGEGWTPELKEQACAMSELLSTLIIADIPDEKYKGNVIDDIYMNLQMGDLDGKGKIVGSASVQKWRKDSDQPLAALIYLDNADAQRLLDQGRFDDLLLHEMIHNLGFISTNDRDDLVNDSNQYIGANALQEFEKYNSEHDLLINWDTGMHWEQDGLALAENELMTRTLDQTNYLSTVTLAALEDLGYETLLSSGTFTDTTVVMNEISLDWMITNDWATL